MKSPYRIATSLLILAVLSAACAPAAQSSPPPIPPTWTATTTAPFVATLSPTLTGTPTAGPFLLDLTPLPSATALPTLILPASPAVPLDLQVWDGLPTYPAESQPDFYFRLRYDPAKWARTTDSLGYPVLANRGLPGCQIRPSAGRGLPLSGSVDHDVRMLGDVTYQISRASVGGEAQFVTYAGGDGRIFTAFEVSFQDQPDLCPPAAESVLATLRSVPPDEATPVAP